MMHVYPDPHWTQVFSALLLPAVAIFGSIIAYQSWRTAHNKLKLDLFEKRVAIYQAIMTLLSSVLTHGKAIDEVGWQFMRDTRGAKWLLDGDIARYIEKDLWPQFINLQCLQSELEGVGVGEVRSKNVTQQRDIKIWFGAQYGAVDAMFAPYLKLEH